MRKPEFWIAYVLLLIAQLLISNYLNITPYVMLTILPVMVLCISIRVGTSGAMVPVAFLRNPIIRLIFGNEVFARREDFSVQRSGFGKVSLAMLLAQAVFLLVYIWADGAGTRPLWFNAARFGASLAAGFAVSLCTLQVLAPDPRR